jgi:hypothetical protein
MVSSLRIWNDVWDDEAKHLPVQGVKWSSTKWIHVASLLDGAAADADADAGAGCIDSEKGCEDWAWADECEGPHSIVQNLACARLLRGQT